jgi:hypothetical protein
MQVSHLSDLVTHIDAPRATPEVHRATQPRDRVQLTRVLRVHPATDVTQLTARRAVRVAAPSLAVCKGRLGLEVTWPHKETGSTRKVGTWIALCRGGRGACAGALGWEKGRAAPMPSLGLLTPAAWRGGCLSARCCVIICVWVSRADNVEEVVVHGRLHEAYATQQRVGRRAAC